MGRGVADRGARVAGGFGGAGPVVGRSGGAFTDRARGGRAPDHSLGRGRRAADPGPGDAIRTGTYNIRLFPTATDRVTAIAQNITDHDLDLVTVFQSAGTTSEMEALSVQSLLEASGIAAIVVGTQSLPNLPEEVRVAQEHVTEAKRIIADALAAGAAGAVEAEKQTE